MRFLKKATIATLALTMCMSLTACSFLPGAKDSNTDDGNKTVAQTYADIAKTLADNATNMETQTKMTIERIELGGGSIAEHTIVSKVSGDSYYYRETSESDSTYADLTNVEYYYVGGTLYEDDGESKTQQTMTEAEFSAYTSVSSPIFALPTLADGKLDGVEFTAENGGSSFEIEFSYGEINDGAPFMDYRNYNALEMTVHVNENYELISVDFSCDETNQIFYEMTVTLINVGSTTVSAPSDTSVYLNN